ncbi:MAG: protein jag [Defluviitaleaceae bacterium]|nr:protein jag [Defluviitaleaceae bacterium]
MDMIEKSAKTVELATLEALKALGATEEECDIVVIDAGAKGGLFGIGAKPAVVKVSRKEDPETVVKNFLREVTLGMGLGMEVDVTKKDRRLYANFTGDGMGILIGKRGQTIDSLQYLANLMINGRGIKDYNVILDTGNYRKRRRDTLEALARNIARKVRDTRQNVKLEPMSRFERHIIHTALQNNKDVRTFSEGNEPHRYVVVGIK